MSNKLNKKLERALNDKFLIALRKFPSQIKTKAKVCQSAHRKRLDHQTNLILEMEARIKQCRDDNNQLTEVILYYHNYWNEEHHGKDEVFRNVIQMPYSKTTNRLDVLKREMEKLKPVKENVRNTPMIARLHEDEDLSQLTISPIAMKNESNSFAQISKPPRSPASSLNASIDSRFDSRTDSFKHGRYKEWHQLESKSVTNRVCIDCFKKESPGVKQGNRQLHKCKECGIYLHFSCRYSVNAKLCIPLPKLSCRARDVRQIDLKELCATMTEPMVPQVLLILMFHVQTHASEAKDLYRATSREREVRELCDQLMDGRAKILARFDVDTAASCLKLMLRSLERPLIPDTIAHILESSDEMLIHNTFMECLEDMSVENRETLVYLIVHLKVIKDLEHCQLDSTGMATLFMPALSSIECATSLGKKWIKVLANIISLDYEFYDDVFTKYNIFHRDFFKNKFPMSNGVH